MDIGGGVQQNRNEGDIDFYGLELNSKFRFNESLWGFAGYSYTQSTNETHHNSGKFVYDNTFTAALSQKAFTNFTFNATLKYMDSWGEASSYTLVNLSVDYEVALLKGLSFELIANNIFDEELDLSEVARDAPEVQTIPKDYSTRYYFGMKYLF